MIPKETLDRLAELELQKYAIRVDRFSEEDARLRDKLYESPIRMAVIMPEESCDFELHERCSRLQGEYKAFKDFREACRWVRLVVLLNGVFVGEPSDILNFRRGTGAIRYFVPGLGQKVADITFLEQKPL